MIVDCAYYKDGRRQGMSSMPLEEAAGLRGQGGFVWLGLFEPDAEELAQIHETFGLHELAIEDAQIVHRRPKIESYDQDVRLVVVRTARYDDEAEEVDFGEISIFVAPTFVITVRQGVASELRAARRRLEQRPDLLTFGTASVLWAILDEVVTEYAPVVKELETDILEIEATVFSGAIAPTERIYSLRRQATGFYRIVHPLLAVITTVKRTIAPPELRPYLVDVEDDLVLAYEDVAAQRDLLSTVLEANLAVISVEQTKVSVRQNATVEQLTILATIFLPLTFVTGFFGQNFEWLVGHINSLAAFLIYGLGGLALPMVLLFWWLKHRKPQKDPEGMPVFTRVG
jgi:magnesium transporter